MPIPNRYYLTFQPVASDTNDVMTEHIGDIMFARLSGRQQTVLCGILYQMQKDLNTALLNAVRTDEQIEAWVAFNDAFIRHEKGLDKDLARDAKKARKLMADLERLERFERLVADLVPDSFWTDPQGNQCQ